VRDLFDSYTQRFERAEAQQQSTDGGGKEVDEFELYNTISDDVSNLNEFERYLRELRAELPTLNALQWWQHNEQHYPILSRIAFDILAALASSSADERIFSKAGNVINKERWHMKDDLAAAVQCLKS